jgi:DNA-binding response OmpR family regulator
MVNAWAPHAILMTERSTQEVLRTFVRQLHQVGVTPHVTPDLSYAHVVGLPAPVLILLDLGCRDFQATCQLPVAVRARWEYVPLLLITDEKEADRLRFGPEVHDFLTLPVALPVLDARLRFAFGRRERAAPTTLEMIEVAGMQVNTATRSVVVNGRPVAFTFKEFELLHFFLTNPRRVYTRGELLTAVWQMDDYGDTRTVDMHVRRLRAKLGSRVGNMIHTVRNVGYRFG